MPYISDEDYQILRAASVIKLGLDAHVAEQEMLQQQENQRIMTNINREVKSFVKRTIMWFFIIMGALIVGAIILSSLA